MFGIFRRTGAKKYYQNHEVLYAIYDGTEKSVANIKALGFEVPDVPISKHKEKTFQIGRYYYRVKPKAGYFYNLKDTDVYGYKGKLEFEKAFPDEIR
jgi:hypothetical protein